MAREYNRIEELKKLARSLRQEIVNTSTQLPKELPFELISIGETEDWLRLEDIYDDAVLEALNYCNVDAVDVGMSASIRDLAKIRYNQEGIEGELARSEGGVSQSFEEGIPKRIRSSLNRYRKGTVGRLS